MESDKNVASFKNVKQMNKYLMRKNKGITYAYPGNQSQYYNVNEFFNRDEKVLVIDGIPMRTNNFETLNLPKRQQMNLRFNKHLRKRAQSTSNLNNTQRHSRYTGYRNVQDNMPYTV